MAVPSAYLTSTKNTGKIFDSLQRASVPTQGFTYEFLKQLGFASSSDRPIIPVLKAIGFLDGSGRPTELYRTYKDPAQARRALAHGLKLGYADLYKIDTEAHEKSQNELAGMFARLSEKGEAVTGKMALTFHALARLADFNEQEDPEQTHEAPAGPDVGAPAPSHRMNEQGIAAPAALTPTSTLTLRHDIHVHLPLSTDVAVYDAIFRSLRENLL